MNSKNDQASSIAFKAGQDAKRMKVPLKRSVLAKLRPGSKQYEDFIDGYESNIKGASDEQGQ